MSPERFVKGESERTQKLLISLPFESVVSISTFCARLAYNGCTYKCIDNRALRLYSLPAVASHTI